MRRALALVAALVLAALAAAPIAEFLVSDACLDAGGRYDPSTGACTSVDPYMPPFSRPGNTLFWLVFLTPVLGVAAGTYAVVSRLLRRAG